MFLLLLFLQIFLNLLLSFFLRLYLLLLVILFAAFFGLLLFLLLIFLGRLTFGSSTFLELFLRDLCQELGLHVAVLALVYDVCPVFNILNLLEYVALLGLSENIAVRRVGGSDVNIITC